MEILIQDTLNQYKTMLTLKKEQRENYFREVLLKPHIPAFNLLYMPITPDALGCMPLTGNDVRTKDMLTQLEHADAWTNAQRTIKDAAERMKKAGIPIPEKLIAGIFLGDPAALVQSMGYSGMGSIPGYIQIVIAPNDYNLPRLNACIAHEFHHNVYFYNAKWNFMEVTLAKYLAVEGLAESFAVSMFGEEFAGPWVTGLSEEALEKVRTIIGRKLDVKGFMEVRKYMYGEHPMIPERKELGIPYCGGYSAGYHAVQAYIKKTGSSVEEASKMDAEDLIRLSDYFKF